MGRENTMATRTMTGLGVALVVALLGAKPMAAQDEGRPFRSMAVDDGHDTLCVIPDPPVELAPTIGHEEAYLYWLEKLELERRLQTGDCDCQVDQITWDEVGERALPWHEDTSVGPGTKRRTILAEIDSLQALVRGGCAG